MYSLVQDARSRRVPAAAGNVRIDYIVTKYYKKIVAEEEKKNSVSPRPVVFSHTLKIHRGLDLNLYKTSVINSEVDLDLSTIQFVNNTDFTPWVY